MVYDVVLFKYEIKPWDVTACYETFLCKKKPHRHI